MGSDLPSQRKIRVTQGPQNPGSTSGGPVLHP